MNLFLMGMIVFLVVMQLVKAIFDIRYSKIVKDILIKRAEVDAQQEIIQTAQWENVVIKFSEVMERLLELEVDMEDLREGISDIIHKLPNPPKAIIKGRGVRGPYGPRKKKEIEHKKTSPDT